MRLIPQSGPIETVVSLRMLTEAEDSKPREGQLTGKVAKVLAIVAGESLNRHNYPEVVLREALPLFDGAPIYANHPGWGQDSHVAVGDLMGELRSPAWDPGLNGVTGLATFLTSAEKLRSDITEMPHQIKFSIMAEAEYSRKFDDSGEYIGTDITKITRVLSLDVVDFPAAGGRTLAVLESERLASQETPKTEETVSTITEEAAQLRVIEAERKMERANEQATQVLLENHRKELAEAQAATQAAEASVLDLTTKLKESQDRLATLEVAIETEKRAKAVAESKATIDKILRESNLPEKNQDRIRKVFEGQAPEASEVLAEVKEHQTLIDEIREGLGAPPSPVFGASAPAPQGEAPVALVEESEHAGKEITSRLYARLGALDE